MSDGWSPSSQEEAAAPPPDGITAGALLRQAREAAGLHVAALAVSLKVPVRKLEALEDNRWDVLPDSVFVRGLASSVCRTLKIDPQPILDRLPKTAAPRLVQSGDGINTPFRAPSDGAPPSWIDQMTKPVYLMVLALLLGALVLILLPSRQEAPPVVAAPAEPAPVPVIPAPVPAPENAPMTQAVAAPTQAPPMPPAPAASAQAPVVIAAPVASAPVRAASAKAAPGSAAASSVTAAASSSAAPAATPASGLVLFRTKGPSWVEVTDGKGVIALRKQMESGDSAGASGALPLHVTIGRVDNTEVQVRGKMYDLRPVSRDNVARFEVK